MAGGTGRNIFARVKTITATHHAQAMINCLRGGLGILLELEADIVDDCGLGDLGKRQAQWLDPTSEVEQVIGVDTERPRGELPEALRVEKRIRPVQFSSVLIAQAVWGEAGPHAFSS